MASTPKHWDTEDTAFWEEEGNRIANRNLWVSIPNLLCGFSVWLYWGMVITTMHKLHFANTDLFNFTFRNNGQPYDEAGYRALLFTLPAVAGLASATLRIPNSFMIAICGGRNVKFMTTVLLIVPALLAGIALQDPNVSFGVLIVLAAMSGVGGGAFASSMSNISFFFPKRMQGLALGLNAGLGNAGVSVMQFLIPWAITFGMFGSIGGDPQTFDAGGTTKQLWIQNAALVWVPVMTVFAMMAWVFMNNLPQHDCGPTPVAIGKYLWLQTIGFVGTAAGIGMLIFVKLPVPELVQTFLVMVVAVAVTMAGMKFMTPKAIQTPLNKQFAIFSNKHNWVMTWLYVMTFGSFIGYSNAFPKLIDDVFVTPTNGLVTSHYIWIGSAIVAVILSTSFALAMVTVVTLWTRTKLMARSLR